MMTFDRPMADRTLAYLIGFGFRVVQATSTGAASFYHVNAEAT